MLTFFNVRTKGMSFRSLHTRAQLRRLRARYESIMHFFGVACPVLSALSILHYAGLIQWLWLFMLWLACGHFLLYFYNLYPLIKYRAFAQGLFVFGVGLQI